VLALDPAAGWTHFVRLASAVERLWEGDPHVPEGDDIAGLEDWLRARSGRPLAVLGSGAGIPASVSRDPALDAVARGRMNRVRRKKDDAELELVERATGATAAGFARAREVIRPGATERQVQIEMEAEMLRNGADGVGFGTIVGAGTHAAVLHFEPGDRVVGKEDVVLVDSGAEVQGYCADVTRTYPAGGRFAPEQQAIYDLVLAAQAGAVSRCRAGTEWQDVHIAAATVFGRGLKDLGILRGSLDGLVESGAVALFFPHGVGHMVGLGVRDVGGTAEGRPEARLCCGVKLRVDLPLEPGFLMTVEPGLYFVPAILDDAERRARFKEAVAWDALDRWRAVGGVRIEDDVLITSGEPRVMTAAIPK
jgi:Xaa-Pro aminopeptidase